MDTRDKPTAVRFKFLHNFREFSGPQEHILTVMPVLVTGIHDLKKDVDTRDKPAHDDKKQRILLPIQPSSLNRTALGQARA